MIIQRITHISGLYANESFGCCGDVQSVRPGPVSCLWLDITDALHRDAHTDAQ